MGAGVRHTHTFGVSWGLVNEHPPLFRYVNAAGWALAQDWLPRRCSIASAQLPRPR
ncbi:MAG: hypothetical protein R2856_03805 [Caldilineaceae bacterium]